MEHEIRKAFSEEDVTNLKFGDKIIIAGQVATRRNRVEDGMEYTISNGKRIVTKMNLRTYHLDKGQIIPISYSTKEVNLK